MITKDKKNAIVTFYTKETIKNDLFQLAEREYLSVSNLMRKIVGEYIRNRKDEKSNEN